MYVCMYVCMHVCMFVCMNVCMYVCMSVCMYVDIDADTYSILYRHVHTYTRRTHRVCEHATASIHSSTLVCWRPTWEMTCLRSADRPMWSSLSSSPCAFARLCAPWSPWRVEVESVSIGGVGMVRESLSGMFSSSRSASAARSAPVLVPSRVCLVSTQAGAAVSALPRSSQGHRT